MRHKEKPALPHGPADSVARRDRCGISAEPAHAFKGGSDVLHLVLSLGLVVYLEIFILRNSREVKGQDALYDNILEKRYALSVRGGIDVCLSIKKGRSLCENGLDD